MPYHIIGDWKKYEIRSRKEAGEEPERSRAGEEPPPPEPSLRTLGHQGWHCHRLGLFWSGLTKTWQHCPPEICQKRWNSLITTSQWLRNYKFSNGHRYCGQDKCIPKLIVRMCLNLQKSEIIDFFIATRLVVWKTQIFFSPDSDFRMRTRYVIFNSSSNPFLWMQKNKQAFLIQLWFASITDDIRCFALGIKIRFDRWNKKSLLI